MAQRRLLACSYGSCAALAVGSLGPWMYGPLQSSGSFGGSGVDGDGVLTLLGAGLVAVALWRWTVSGRRSMLIAAPVIALACIAVAGYSLYDIHDLYSPMGITGANQVGWGLVLALISAIVLTVLCLLLYRRARSGDSRPLGWPAIGVLAAVAAALALGFVVASAADFDLPPPEVVPLAGEPGPWTRNSKELDRMILALQPGISLEAVQSRLGKPVSATALEDELSVLYGTWQLVFTAQGLETRTRHYKPRPELDGRALSRKIVRLRLGTSIEAVRSKLGKPEALQLYENEPRKEEDLWYGPWRLSFTDGVLEGRYRL